MIPKVNLTNTVHNIKIIIVRKYKPMKVEQYFPDARKISRDKAENPDNKRYFL